MKQVHRFTLTFDVSFDMETEETDADCVDMTQLINAAQALLARAKRKPYNHYEIFDHIETYEK